MTYARAEEPVEPGLRLHLNENTAGCSPAVLAALQSMSREEMAFYPDYGRATRTAERWFSAEPGWVQLTNGLDEGLHVVAQWARLNTATPSDPRTVIIVEPAFEMYAACAEAAGVTLSRIPSGEDFAFPLQAVLDAVTPRTRLIYLTDPNNPTGLPIPAGAIERIAEIAPQALVLADEAYGEFSGRTLIGPLLARRPNIVVGRTFAKAHGLAGLRIGALIASPTTLQPLRRILPPFSLNVCAVRALEAALGDEAYLEWYVAQASESKRIVYEWCGRRRLRFWPSQANFVLIQTGDAARIVRELAARSILARDRSREPGCDGCIRITAGVVEHTERCLSALEEILETRPR